LSDKENDPARNEILIRIDVRTSNNVKNNAGLKRRLTEAQARLDGFG